MAWISLHWFCGTGCSIDFFCGDYQNRKYCQLRSNWLINTCIADSGHAMLFKLDWLWLSFHFTTHSHVKGGGGFTCSHANRMIFTLFAVNVSKVKRSQQRFKKNYQPYNKLHVKLNYCAENITSTITLIRLDETYPLHHSGPGNLNNTGWTPRNQSHSYTADLFWRFLRSVLCTSSLLHTSKAA